MSYEGRVKTSEANTLADDVDAMVSLGDVLLACNYVN